MFNNKCKTFQLTSLVISIECSPAVKRKLTMKEKIAVAMSGGVDSSTSAYLLQKEGYDIFGTCMRLPRNEDNSLEQAEVSEIDDARTVCEKLGIPFYDFDFADQFREKVIDYLKKEYITGHTPNPCAVCNKQIKFGLLLERAQKLGADRIATGHYAQSEFDKTINRFLLKKGKDHNKDQSYFLSLLTQDQLAHIIFPLGTMSRPEVRKLAKQVGLPVHNRKSSQDICFINSDYRDMFASSKGEGAGFVPGLIKNMDGTVVGEHEGIAKFTIGQRKGVGAHSKPMYVVRIEPETNTVIIGDDEVLFTKECRIKDVNWIMLDDLKRELQCKARIRYRHAEQNAVVRPEQGGSVYITFDEPQRAITPGQLSVLYEGDAVIGAGTIE
jgi:tRNA-specific 2-thiouridylase